LKKAVLVFLVFLVVAGLAFAETGVKKKRPLPFDYGKVVLQNFSQRAGMATVQFDHWLHRSMFTCRLCHVDIGFAMEAGKTGIRASDNSSGYYCGTCHNGRRTINGKAVFEACSTKSEDEDTRRCERCHSFGGRARRTYDFRTYTASLPKERFGNGIDWEKAEAEGIITLIDFIEGVSIPRQKLAVKEDFSLAPKAQGMPDIIFSHQKHTAWNGCEVCHPEIFVGVKKGMTKYSMPEIYEGKFCGVCHGKVAFPLLDCQRCHTKPV
jgi:c(7)-type cytochrome triheme protein